MQAAAGTVNRLGHCSMAEAYQQQEILEPGHPRHSYSLQLTTERREHCFKWSIFLPALTTDLALVLHRHDTGLCAKFCCRTMVHRAILEFIAHRC